MPPPMNDAKFAIRLILLQDYHANSKMVASEFIEAPPEEKFAKPLGISNKADSRYNEDSQYYAVQVYRCLLLSNNVIH